MTGKEFIIYILENNLENEEIFENGRIKGFLTEEELAVKLGTGTETIRAWYMIGRIKGIKVGDKVYFPLNNGGQKNV